MRYVEAKYDESDGTITLPNGQVFRAKFCGLTTGTVVVKCEFASDRTNIGLPELGEITSFIEFEYQIEKPRKPVSIPSFWRTFSAAPPPVRIVRPETFPRRTGRRSRDGRWFRGDRQLATVGAS